MTCLTCLTGLSAVAVLGVAGIPLWTPSLLLMQLLLVVVLVVDTIPVLLSRLTCLQSMLPTGLLLLLVVSLPLRFGAGACGSAGG